jgi:hypothetical protein
MLGTITAGFAPDQAFRFSTAEGERLEAVSTGLSPAWEVEIGWRSGD